MGVPLMGCENLSLCVGIFLSLWRVHLRRFKYCDEKQSPDFWSGGFAEYPIRDTIHKIVLNLLATKIWVVFV